MTNGSVTAEGAKPSLALCALVAGMITAIALPSRAGAKEALDDPAPTSYMRIEDMGLGQRSALGTVDQPGEPAAASPPSMRHPELPIGREARSSAVPQYVAMGSSFAAGPGIPPLSDGPKDKCSRSSRNYAQILSRKRRLDLVDVSCSGATTDSILDAWNGLPAQLEAVTAKTSLVTITIGGNDVGYIASLFAASCRNASGSSQRDSILAICKQLAARSAAIPNAAAKAVTAPDEAAWQRLQSNLHSINEAIRHRAAKARIIYVTYTSILPFGPLCPEVPLSNVDAANAARLASRLAEVTKAVAKADGVGVIAADTLSLSHDACAEHPWAGAFIPRNGVPPSASYHPNEDGMAAIAKALNEYLDKS